MDRFRPHAGLLLAEAPDQAAKALVASTWCPAAASLMRDLVGAEAAFGLVGGASARLAAFAFLWPDEAVARLSTLPGRLAKVVLDVGAEPAWP